MKKIIVCLLILSASAHASIRYNGFGFLFPDHNSTRNPAQLARTSGFGLQALGAKFTGTHEQALVLSTALSTGTWGISAYASRYGMDPELTSASEDIFGAALGYSAGSLAFGVSAEREQDVYQTIARTRTYATVKGSVTYQSGDFVLGASARSTVDNPASQVQSFELAAGFRSGGSALESVTTISSQTSNWTTGILGTWQGQSIYASGGGIYVASLESFQMLARFGVVLGKVDLSGFVTHIFHSRENPFHGMTLRLAF